MEQAEQPESVESTSPFFPFADSCVSQMCISLPLIHHLYLI